ncbi:MAG: integrase, partial [Gammaproteobacteria bacterium]|nr:integrase [Gammaproteobacteria bacterium]
QAKILQQLQDPYVRLAVRLQAAFGLRREEAIKLMPHLADRGQELYLKPSWCKGGRERTLPIRNQHQRQVLDEAHELAGSGSLIPSHLRYVEQLRIFERATSRAGLGNTHGLRHHYAQARYAELTGWECPLNEGPDPQSFSPEQQEVDREARQIVSQELGHERIQITNIYLGK